MVPKLPTTQQEIILQDPWTQTLARERFLLSDDSDDSDEAGNRIIVFATAVLPLVPSHRVEDVWFQALEDNDDNTAAV